VKNVPNMDIVVSQDSPATRKSSFRERLSQKFSTKKTSPIMAKKEQKPGVCWNNVIMYIENYAIM